MQSSHHIIEANLIGIAGVILILTAYFLLQINRITARNFIYSLINAIGSLLILISLFFCWNLPSAVIEVIWLGISLFGLAKIFLAKQADH